VRSRAGSLLGALVAVFVLVTGCTGTPPVPVVTTPVAPVSPGISTDLGEIIVGMDSVAGGYNPHKVADQSAITSAMANLMLPSVFRPAADGTEQLDRTLMVSADVTNSKPYTVTYRLRGDASWSDGAPVAAEDFVYLWEQLRGVQGVVDAAGYRLIANITAREAGKVVEVTFTQPYPGWRTLFADLLPAHLLKDAPGGWASALADSFPATAGPFSVKTMDVGRGEIILQRNDRYWETPALAERLVLRRGDQTDLVDALRTKHEHVVMASTDAVGVEQLKALGSAVKIFTVPRPTVASVLLRPEGPELSDSHVRSAIAAFLDRNALIAAGTGGGPSARLRADALVLAPSRGDYKPTIPAAKWPAVKDVSGAEGLLTQAGYTKTSGVWLKNGRPLDVTVAAPADNEPYQKMAQELQRELSAVGVQVRLISPTAEQLVTQLAMPVPPGQTTNTDGAIDIALLPRPAGGDPAAVLADDFGCMRTGESAQYTPANLAGYCDTGQQAAIDAALTGAILLPDTLSQLEPQLWRDAVVIPLYQESESLAIRPEMSGVGVGAPLAGPFSGVVGWHRTGS
jgi:ABC-type transport system substrate-binding protein